MAPHSCKKSSRCCECCCEPKTFPVPGPDSRTRWAGNYTLRSSWVGATDLLVDVGTATTLATITWISGNNYSVTVAQLNGIAQAYTDAQCKPYLQINYVDLEGSNMSTVFAECVSGDGAVISASNTYTISNHDAEFYGFHNAVGNAKWTRVWN